MSELAERLVFGLFPFVLAGVLSSPNSFDQLVEEVESQSSQQVVEQGKGQIKRPGSKLEADFSSSGSPLRCGPSQRSRVP